MSARRLAIALLLVIAALGLRLAYVDATPNHGLRGDERDYDAHARSVAIGQGFSKIIAHGRPTAFRPPGYPYLLGGIYRVAGVEDAPKARRVHVARVAGAVIGTIAVALVGVLAAQLWGSTVALVALALAAIYVPLITVGGAVMSEPLFVVFMLASLSAALQVRRSPQRWRWVVLAGVLAGLAALTRANAVVLLAPLAVAVWDQRPRWSWRALAPPLALIAIAAVTIAPWTIRNAVELHSFVPISTQLGSALAGTYNDQARHDSSNPASWRSVKRVPAFADLTARVRQIPEPVLERELRQRALRYIGDHPFYVAEVAFWATRRTLDLAGRDWSRHTASTVGIDRKWADRGVLCFWVFAVLALLGATTQLARRTPLFVWAVPALMFLSVVLLVVETPRYRTALDPFTVALAALAIVTVARRVGSAPPWLTSTRAPVADSGPASPRTSPPARGPAGTSSSSR